MKKMLGLLLATSMLCGGSLSAVADMADEGEKELLNPKSVVEDSATTYSFTDKTFKKTIEKWNPTKVFSDFNAWAKDDTVYVTLDDDGFDRYDYGVWFHVSYDNSDGYGGVKNFVLYEGETSDPLDIGPGSSFTITAQYDSGVPDHRVGTIRGAVSLLPN